jgi:urease accessory protein
MGITMEKIMATITDRSLLRLIQLSSASLPVGGYSFSQGLEYAIEAGWLKDQQAVKEWMSMLMLESIAYVDLPILIRLMHSLEESHSEKFIYWNASVLACRETDELLLTETAMGEALSRLLKNLDIDLPVAPEKFSQQDLSFIAGFAVAAHHWNISADNAAVGYLWSWMENQVAAATKLVPLGQTMAQQLLVDLGEMVDEVIALSQTVDDENIGSCLPGMAMASCWHETQYSRLFRS